MKISYGECPSTCVSHRIYSLMEETTIQWFKDRTKTMSNFENRTEEFLGQNVRAKFLFPLGEMVECELSAVLYPFYRSSRTGMYHDSCETNSSTRRAGVLNEYDVCTRDLRFIVIMNSSRTRDAEKNGASGQKCSSKAWLNEKQKKKTRKLEGSRLF